MSETVTTEIPVQPAAPPPSRWGRLRSRFDAMTPRTRWLNLILLVLLILAIVLAFTLIGNPSTPTVAVRTVAVSRGTVTSSVTGSGNAASSVSTPVSFQTSGTVTAVNVKAGDTVTLGEVLATVDPTTSKSSLQTAQAQLDSAKAALGQAASGPTAVKKQQDQQAVTTAQQGVANANASVTAAQNQLGLDTTSAASAVDNAQTKLGNDQDSTNTSVQTAKTQLQSDTTSQDTATQNAQQQLATDTKAEQAAQTAQDPGNSASPCALNAVAMTAQCTTAQQTYKADQATVTKDQQAVTTAQEARSALIKKDQLAVTSAEQAQTATLDADQQAITTAQQTQASTLLKDNTAITTDKQQVTTEQGMVTTSQLAAQADLHPETPDQIAQAQAQVDEAQVSVDTAQNGVDETELKAPQAGVVLAVNGKVGESSSGGSSSSTSTGSTGTGGAASAASASTSSAGTGFVTIANLSQLAVTANIAEADAAKIKLGQPATITFPATNTTATGSVTQITPQSTITNNVVLYPIQVSLDSAPPGVGVGSTASLSITAGSATDVLEVPNLAITSLGTRHTVTVRRDGSDTVVPVTIGMAGDTETEIISGVGQGDVLVLPSPTAGTTTGTGAGAGFPRTGG